MRLALVLTFLVALIACGGSSSLTATPSLSPTRDPAEIVREVPLTLSEMPAGWAITPSEEALDSLVDLSAECDIFDLDVVFPGALATAQSESYQGLADQQGQSFAAVFGTEAEAEAAIGGTLGIVDRCGDEFKDVLKGAAEDQLAALGISIGFLGHINVSLENRDTTPLGDSSAGYRVAVEVNALGTSQSFTVDYQIFREGTIVAASQYATFGNVNEAEEADISRSLDASAVSAMSPSS